MKPLLLEMTAFGPFAETEAVDFSSLPVDRPFVIGGQTGSGKSSIFDAMTFALYGALPSRRRVRRRSEVARSDHASPDAECVVRLEFEARQRRWRVTRRPPQSRARRRGTGEAQIAATATLEELRGTTWVPVAAKIGEVDSDCEELVGLTADQFQRVVLLPQGEFARVLDADTDEREGLLRTLFGTGVFADALSRLKAERHTIGAAIDASLQRSQGRLAAARTALDEASAELGCEDGPGGPDDEESTQEDPGALGDRLVVLADHLSRRREEADGAERAAARDAAALAAAEAVAADVSARHELEQSLERLEAERAEIEGAEAALRASDSAEAILDALGNRDRLAAEAEEARVRQHRTWDQVCELAAGGGLPVPAEPLEQTCDRLLEEATVLATRLERAEDDLKQASALRREAEAQAEAAAELEVRLDSDNAGREAARQALQCLSDALAQEPRLIQERRDASALVDSSRRMLRLAERHRAAQEALAALDADATGLEARCEGLRVELRSIDEELDGLGDLVAQEASAQRAVESLRRLAERRDRLEELSRELSAAESLAGSADSRAREALEMFLASVAPRLAAELESGDACPVCGSMQHPSPATADPGSEALEVRDVDVAREQAAEAAERVASLRAEMGGLLAANPDLAEVADESALEDAESQLGRVAAAAERTRTLGARRDRLQSALSSAEEARHELTESRHGHRLELARVGGLAGDGPVGDEDAARLMLEGAEADLARCETALEQIQGAKERSLEMEKVERELADRIRLAEIESARLSEARSALEASASEAEAAARAVCPEGDPAARAAAVAELTLRLRDASEALARVAQATRRHSESAELARSLLASSAFEDESSARRAGLSSEQRDRLAARVEHWHEATRSALAGMELFRTRGVPEEPPDLGPLTKRSADSAERASELRGRASRAEAHLGTASEQLRSVEAESCSSQGLRRRAEALERICSVLSGHNTDRRITLETWVLRRHLAEVLDVANVHFAGMSHGRYRLELGSGHVHALAKTGLDILVQDSFSGRTRPTSTLSGGESFQASLSLALGLADVLTCSESGRRVEALFVDEGFGSLDADAVEQAVGILDELRGRGMMVGVITHLEPLKEALEVALEVTRREDGRGSTIRSRELTAVA